MILPSLVNLNFHKLDAEGLKDRLEEIGIEPNVTFNTPGDDCSFALIEVTEEDELYLTLRYGEGASIANLL